jgi:dextranase
MGRSGNACFLVLLLLLGTSLIATAGSVSLSNAGWNESTPVVITHVVTDRARYSPGESVNLTVDLENKSGNVCKTQLVAVVQDLGRTVASRTRWVELTARQRQRIPMLLSPPKNDYHGYRVEVRLLDERKQLLSLGSTAIDVSSDWTRFPRYGYLAHFEPGLSAAQWLAELNRFHIDGLQFYDFQYKHHLPVPPPEQAKLGWHDVANRPISATTLAAFLAEARKYNITTMAYNASYAAYDDAFSDGSGVKLEWAAWPEATSPRVASTTKSFVLPAGWATPRIVYMNQDDPGWQHYIFSRMQQLFAVFPFDGWHVDSYGAPGAFAWDGTPIDYFSGFAKFADAAHASLRRPVLLNTVGGHGQKAMASSSVAFVYSELWPEDHPTYESILQAADQIHAAAPNKAVVFAAYLHRELSDRLQQKPGHVYFDSPAVLLADAVIFASGASHIELGDGDRMLSNPYFPADTAITPTGALRKQLRSYYDFLVAYENYLRDGVMPGSFSMSLSGARQTTTGEPGAVWTIARQKGNDSIVHLINLTSLKGSDWRDDGFDHPAAPRLCDVKLAIDVPPGVDSVGWASPDVDQGAWHSLTVERNEAGSPQVTVPELDYWSVVIFHRSPAGM